MKIDKDAIEQAIRNEELIRNNTPIVIASSVGREIVQRVFNMQNVNIITKKEDFKTPQGSMPDKSQYDSVLGTPILANLTFQVSPYLDIDGTNKATESMRLETVLLSINQTKNIVKTAVSGSDGTVKEYMGMGDYSITINGILTAPNGQYPKRELLELRKILTAPTMLTVTSWWLQKFDIFYLAVDSFDFPQVEGGYSIQPFTINALSDKEKYLRLS